MHHAAAHVVGATVEACRQVWSGESVHSVSITGGLHHAMPDRSSGFCVYNDVAIGIQSLLDQGPSGWRTSTSTSTTATASSRSSGTTRGCSRSRCTRPVRCCSPDRFPTDLGGPGAEGTAVNVALPSGTGDAGWLRGFHAVVPLLMRAYEPEILITQHGCDSHMEDPLAHLMLSVDGQRASYLALHDLATSCATDAGSPPAAGATPWSRWCRGPGCTCSRSSPATPWTCADGAPGLARPRRADDRPHRPRRLTDGRTPAWRDWSEGYDPDSSLDRAVLATREAAFPLHGLDPCPEVQTSLGLDEPESTQSNPTRRNLAGFE